MRSPYWHKKKQTVSHMDDWLMTYADMITLLLCFFAIFIAISVPKKHTQKAQLPKIIEHPVTPPENIIQGNLPFYGRERPGAPIQQPVVAPPPTVDHLALPGWLNLEHRPEEFKPVVEEMVKPLEPVVAPPPVTENVAQVSEVAVEKPAATLQDIINNLKSMGPATIEQKGDRITTFEASSAAFFGSGSSTLSEAGKRVLRDVAANISSDQFKNYQITVEGHTDDSPIKTLQFPSNWELSTARAAAVVQYFIHAGIPAQRLRAAGYADTFPKAPNRDEAGKPLPHNQAQNRRVVIKLEKIDKVE